MQSPAEKCLVEKLIVHLKKPTRDGLARPKILNIGAGRSISIERQLTKCGCNYLCDRLDIVDCAVEHPCVRKCWKCSVESMSCVTSNDYVAAFANYVLEHVSNLNKTSHEIYRVLKPGGIFIASASNPASMDQLLARNTPLWFHKIIRGGEAWEICYAYNSVGELTKIFELAGFCTIEVRYESFTYGYLFRFAGLGILSWVYDKIVSALGIRRLMNNVCVIFEKPS